MLEIRQAGLEDVVELIPLVGNYWRFENISGFDPQRVAGQLARLFSAPNLGSGWLALVDGATVGYLLAVYVFSLEHLGLTAEIDEFFVMPEARGQGAGAALLRAAESEFARLGCTNVALQLSRDNDAARAFYRHHDYRERSGYELLDKTIHPH
jgi:GNAT superfamily N-acetyltransferase